MSAPLNIVFAGTPAFAVPSLERLLASRHRVAAVYTQPDRPAGRGRQLQMSPVKECALHHGVPVQQPITLRTETAVAELAWHRPDVMIVVAYGLLLPQAILDVPRLGCFNVHASLLPRWRGAAPIQRALLAGDRRTGVGLMRMEAGLDTGPVVLERAVEIGLHETAGSLHDRLAPLGADVLLEGLEGLLAGRLVAQPQSHDGITYARKILKEEALIDWSRPAAEIDRQIRAFNPVPGAATSWRGQQLKVWEAMPVTGHGAAAPGAVLAAAADGIVVAAGTDALRLTRMQLAGRRPVSAGEFLHAHPMTGERLGETAGAGQ